MAGCGLGLGLAHAQEVPLEGWELNVSPFSQHFNHSAEHRPVYAVALQKGEESGNNQGNFLGVSAFSNSFGQPSAYAYLGRRYRGLFGIQPLYAQWTAGVLYGYKPPYQNKVPMNVNGFSPGLIPSVGYQFNERHGVQLTFLGDAALMINFTKRLK